MVCDLPVLLFFLMLGVYHPNTLRSAFRRRSRCGGRGVPVAHLPSQPSAGVEEQLVPRRFRSCYVRHRHGQLCLQHAYDATYVYQQPRIPWRSHGVVLH